MAWTVITGASSGIGKAVAETLAPLPSSQLLLIARRADKLEELANFLSKRARAEISYLAFDVSRAAEDTRFKDWLNSTREVKDLVNAAGIGKFNRLNDLSVKDFREIIATNLEGLFLMTQQFVQYTDPQQKIRTVVNVSSDADHLGFNSATAYCASKFGVRGLSRVWQTELREQKVRVCNLSPGRVDTHFNDKKPGMRLGALAATDVAQVICFLLNCSDNIEITQVSLDSMSRSL